SSARAGKIQRQKRNTREKEAALSVRERGVEAEGCAIQRDSHSRQRRTAIFHHAEDIRHWLALKPKGPVGEGDALGAGIENGDFPKLREGRVRFRFRHVAEELVEVALGRAVERKVYRFQKLGIDCARGRPAVVKGEFRRAGGGRQELDQQRG